MNDWTDHVIYHVGSGNAFFYGVGLILAGIGMSPWTTRRWLAIARNLLVLLGGVVVAISATPLPWWAYAVLGADTLFWLYGEIARPSWLIGRIVLARFAVAGLWLLAVGFEAPHQFMPTLPHQGKAAFFVIGDSVSAGVRERDPGTWPNLLAAKHDIDVRDFSRMGATVKSARKQAERLGDDGGLVLLEIGGNDLLGSTSADDFGTQLELLLADVCRENRTVVMLELPLTPFANRFGMIQRRLADSYGVILVPKRFFVGILTTSGATLDGVHLSPAGHALMADSVWEVIRSAYGG